MIYSDYLAQTASTKVVLAQLHARERLKVFNLYSGAVYSKTVSHFVVEVFQDTTALAKASSTSLTSGQWFFDQTTNTLYVRMLDDAAPKMHDTIVTYRLFYSNMPTIQAYDLSSGAAVYYEGRIKSIGELNLELDTDMTGLAIESESEIKLENSDGHFDDIFDKLIFENQIAQFFSWNPNLAITQAQKIFSGYVYNKAFSSTEVTFSMKDEMLALRAIMPAPVFSNSDGELATDDIGNYKPILFGRMRATKCTGIDKILSDSGGYIIQGLISGSTDQNLLAGTVTGNAGTSTITGTGTTFTTKCNNGDKVKISIGSFDYIYTVNAVSSDTSMTVSETISASFAIVKMRNLNILNNLVTGVGCDFTNQFSLDDKLVIFINGVEYDYDITSITDSNHMVLNDDIKLAFTSSIAYCNPNRNYYKKNRQWLIAGHKLRQFQTTVTTVKDSSNYILASVAEIEYGDVLYINSNIYSVIHVSGSQITLNQTSVGPINVGDTVTKLPVYNAYLGTDKIYYNRDYTITNSSTGCILNLNNNAEFNITIPTTLPKVFIFTNGSNTVTCADSTYDLTKVINPRDWVRPNIVTYPNWYEVFTVSKNSFTLRNTFIDSTVNSLMQDKSPIVVGDDSVVTVDCIGMEYNSTWVKTPADAVKYILSNLGITQINTASFISANSDFPGALSLSYYGTDIPIARDMISDINISCIGSLFLDNNFNFTYKVLNADKDAIFTTITDSDIVNFEVETRQQICNTITVQYSPSTDKVTGVPITTQYIYEGPFVDHTSKFVVDLPLNLYLYNQNDAQNIAARYGLFRSLTSSLVTVKGKMDFYLNTLNDRMYLQLKRLYKRFGSSLRYKIGIVSKITKNESGVTLTFNDLGNIYTRVACIAPSGTVDYNVAPIGTIASCGYICDTYTETPDASKDDELGNNVLS